MSHGPIVTRTAKSTFDMIEMVTHLTSLSCWFEVEPLPDDEYSISVKKDVAHLAFPEPKLYTVLVLRPDYAAQNYGQDTYLAHVKAAAPLQAQHLARMEAANADRSDAPQDYYIQLVIEGHHFDKQVEDAT